MELPGTWRVRRPAAAAALIAVTAALGAGGSPASGGDAGRPSDSVNAGTRTQAASHVPSPAQSFPWIAASRTPSPSPTPAPTTARPAVDPVTAVREALDALGPHTGRYTLAVEDLGTGVRARYGERTGTYDTASIVKVDILAALLLRGHGGIALTPGQRQLAEKMIRQSDNDATDVLWSDLGGPRALDAANDTLGLGHTTAGDWGTWGLTQTTAADQITLLQAVFGDDSPLTAAARDYIRSLMGSIVPGQDWGVTAASDPGADRILKNGWLPRTRTKLWDVNSIGVVAYEGHELLVSVLSADQRTREDGIALVERVARTAVTALVGAGPSAV
ncbi:hypothetical protein SRB5_19430 [Streptomyces sp. RB5]|uniref:Beta-lactamase class A catalytic domain-containing protein n=1 Tax=Streptomyces smaragdinus TaxID=2585196 RepID=A0A7K0CGF4_9ACTN|nr:serine hydrolase [Streptomyces smaragdinus]MQY11824.1 hypothetical protein [Streptomyces smaragdinus]